MHEATKTSLLRAFVRIARFPAGWFAAPTARALAFLGATAGKRLGSRYGVLRRTRYGRPEV
jgi:hypothetical protein